MESFSIDGQLLQNVRGFQSEMTSFCSRFIRTPSVNGVDDEINAAEVIASQAYDLGLHVEMAGQNPQRPSVIISTAAEGKTGLLLLGHLDTVPAGDEARWHFPPFSGMVADGRIYGRGAIDTKGGMTAALYALAALARTEGALETGRAQLICLPDEESGATGTLGIKYLHANGLLSALGAIYAYSGDQVTLGHRGLIRYRITCTGEAIHTGSEAWQDGKAGANAVTGMARLLLELERLTTLQSKAKYFEHFRTVITPGTVVKGGVSINIVPDECEALVDIRLTPEYDLQRVESLIESCFGRALGGYPKLRLRRELLNYVPVAISDENAAVVLALEGAVRKIKAKTPERVVAGPANEGYLLIERDIPTICGFGVSGENAHAIDEYVEISSLGDTAAIFCLTARQLSHYLAHPK